MYLFLMCFIMYVSFSSIKFLRNNLRKYGTTKTPDWFEYKLIVSAMNNSARYRYTVYWILIPL